MECPHHELPRLPRPDHDGYPFLHFACCLLGKCQREYPFRLSPLLEDICNPACQDSRLSRTRSRHNEHRSVHTADSMLLLTVQPL